MQGSALDDDGPADVCKIKHLKSLAMEYAQITHAGLQHLQDLPELETLEIDECPFSGLPTVTTTSRSYA